MQLFAGLTRPTLALLPPAQPIITTTGSDTEKRINAGLDDFRDLFPASICYPQIVPVDEGVTIVLFHREDDLLQQLMLTDEETHSLDRLWHELRYVSQDALKIHDSFNDWWNYGAHYSKFSRASREIPIRERAKRFREELKSSESLHLIAFGGNPG